MNDWQKLCDQINPLINAAVDEDLFHTLFESYLKTIFNWDDTCLRHKLPVPMGTEIKEADIVLEGNGFGIVIEMKRPSIELGIKEEGQLTSYMRILGYKYGLLIGNKIKLFYDDDTNNDNPQLIASINFDINNSDGIELGNILNRTICSNEKLKEYIIERIRRLRTAQEISQLFNELIANNGEKIKDIVIDKLISDGYDEENISGIFEDINITRNISNESTIYTPRNKTEMSAAAMAEIFYIRKYGSDAKMKIHSNNEFVVLKGSKIAQKVHDYSSATNSRPKHKNKISTDFILLEDISFPSSSSAACFVTGGSENGLDEWKTINGKTLKRINREN